MWRNYFAAAIHDLFRHRAYAALNIAGLALGLAAMLLITLFVRDEYSFDAQFADAARIYRLSSVTLLPGQAPIHMPTTTANIAAALELDFPEVESATRLKWAIGALKQGDIEVVPDYLLWADPDFFSMFPVRTLAGDAQAALARPDGAVLSRKLAMQLYGRTDVVGRTLTFNRKEVLRIGAVIEDMPWNSHFVLDFVGSGLASFSQLAQADQAAANPAITQPGNIYTYVKLHPGASIQTLRAAMDQFMQRHYPNKAALLAAGATEQYSFVPLRDLHFQPPSAALDMKAPDDPSTVQAMMLIALVILTVAAANFVSMMTARAAGRAIEVGVRRALGATRAQVAWQFLAECLFYAALALVVALLAVWLLLPAFDAFLQRGIGFDFARDPWLALLLLGVWLLVGVAAGLYPALVLSRFRPVSVLRGISLPRGRPGWLRQGMVVLQFGTLVTLLIATATIHRQTLFALHQRLNVPGEQVFWSQFSCGVAPGLRDAVAGLPGVQAASCASEWDQTGIMLVFPGEDASLVRVRGQPMDAAYLPLFGISPIAGRLLDAAHGADNTLANPPGGTGTPATPSNPAIVINASAARALGYQDPRQVVGQYRRWRRPEVQGTGTQLGEPRASQIVGVIPDFSLGSVRDRIEPTAYYLDPPTSFSLYLRLDGQRIADTMRAVEAAWKRSMGAVPFKGRFLDQVLQDLYRGISRQATLISAFSLIAVAVAALGLLGLAIYTAERSTHEIGIRKALGASRGDVLRFIGWQFARPVLLANLIAWPVAWLLMRRWLQGFAYHVDLGVPAFVLASALALVIACLTVCTHAVMVARARPVDALRYE